MTEHYDALETRKPGEREAELFSRLPDVLSKAMAIYSDLVEKRPNDGRLGEKLHQCMQLRYGAVKQRRFD